jgi:hypothetical protein
MEKQKKTPSANSPAFLDSSIYASFRPEFPKRKVSSLTNDEIRQFPFWVRGALERGNTLEGMSLKFAEFKAILQKAKELDVDVFNEYPQSH